MHSGGVATRQLTRREARLDVHGGHRREQRSASQTFGATHSFGAVTPAHVVTLDGVPALTAYVNPKSRRFVP